VCGAGNQSKKFKARERTSLASKRWPSTLGVTAILNVGRIPFAPVLCRSEDQPRFTSKPSDEIPPHGDDC